MIYCKYALIILSIFFFYQSSVAQTSRSNLNKQVKFCKDEVERLEKEIDGCKKLLDVQNQKVTDLKDTIVSKEADKAELNKQIVDLQSASVILLEVAQNLEEQDQPLEALKIYQLIKDIYPGTLESSSALFRIRKIHGKIRSSKKEEKKKKKKKK